MITVLTYKTESVCIHYATSIINFRKPNTLYWDNVEIINQAAVPPQHQQGRRGQETTRPHLKAQNVTQELNNAQCIFYKSLLSLST